MYFAWTLPSSSSAVPNRRFPSCISPLFQSESKCEAFHMEISFIHTQILVHLHVNKTNFHMKGFALGVALKQRRKATRKSPIVGRYLSRLHLMFKAACGMLSSTDSSVKRVRKESTKISLMPFPTEMSHEFTIS